MAHTQGRTQPHRTARAAARTAASTIRPLLTERDILAQLQVSRTTLYVYRRERGFPQPLLIGGSRLRWRAEHVEEWLAAQPRAGGAEAA